MSNESILKARNELYLAMRYLFLPLNSLNPAVDKSTFLLATDGQNLLYNPMMIEQKSMINQVLVNRAYLHSVLHCMFCHPFVRPGNIGHRAQEKAQDAVSGNALWDIACDVAVEYIIDGLELKCVQQIIPERRENIYKMLEGRYSVVSAQNVYEYLRHMNEEEQGQWESIDTFKVDDHKYWYSSDKNDSDNKDGDNNDNDRNNNGSNDKNEQSGGEGKGTKLTQQLCRQLNVKWEQTAKRAGSEMEAFTRTAGTVQASMVKALKPECVQKLSYREFLRRFAVVREEMHTDLDSFDYGFYNYGLMTYNNIPLIEELEYREEQRIEDFVVVLDTSGSCAGRVIQKFLDETFSVLSTEEMFADRTRIHIIQCDNQIQSDTVIRSRKDIERFKENFEVKGFGGTDFRPAFEYVKALTERKEISNMRGLLYFTDGHGIYPKARTAYKTAFIFPQEDEAQKNVPPWAMKMILGQAF